MDERNGQLFDHHDELFAQIGSAETDQELKDLVVLDPSGLLDMTGSAIVRGGGAGGGGIIGPSSSVSSIDAWGHCATRGPDTMSFPILNNCIDNGSCGPIMNQIIPQRNLFNSSDTLSYDPQLNAPHVDSTSSASFLDSLVKTLPDDLLDGYHGLESIKRTLMSIPEKPSYHGSSNHLETSHQQQVLPAALLENMHRISTDKSTQDYLDSLSKTGDGDENLDKVMNSYEPKTMDHPTWNGISNNVDHFNNFQNVLGTKTTSDSVPFLPTIDKNGNCPIVFNNGLSDKGKSTLHSNAMDLINREICANFLVKNSSPSVSAESGIHTATTSYDSASPLSSGRTPLLSDDSISPLTSCASPAASVRTPASPLPRTPLRTDDCFSPGRVRRSDTSPMVRTPLRYDEAPSPRAVNRTPVRCDEAPSPRAVARTPLRGDDAQSPRSVPRTPLRPDEALSPRPVSRTPLRNDESPSPRAVSWTPQRCEEAPSPRSINRTPVRCDESQARTTMRIDEVPSPRPASRTAVRLDVSPLARNARSEDPTVQSPASLVDVSPLPRVDTSPKTRTPFSPEVSPQAARTPMSPLRTDCSPRSRGTLRKVLMSPRPDAVERRETETVAPCEPPPDLLAGPERTPAGCQSSPPEQTLEYGHASSRIVRVTDKSDSKPRKRKKTETLCVPTPKKRSRKKPVTMPIYQSSVSGEESGIKLKLKLTSLPPVRKRKKHANDGLGAKGKRKKRRSLSPAEQSPWGRDLPPNVLERIFKMVVDDQGCVPSLVRYSWVCRLWNTVATKAELWQNVDLSSPCIKQKCKIDRYFRWLLENRLGTLRNLNLNGWKFSNLPMVLSLIGTHCSEVESIGLSGWQGLHFEHLRSLLQDCPRISRIDLSDVSPESKSTNSAVSPKSITYLTETMSGRLTELTLAHNTLSSLPQIISSLATHCPNLQILDLSNIRRASHTEFALHIEELQGGCPLLRVLRITNSCITLATVPFDQQAASPGFPALEELSIAGHQGTESLRITSVMDDDCLVRIVKNSQKLRLLDVRGCTRITDSSLVRVPAWDIQHLFLSGCVVTRQSGSGLELIAQKWSHSLVEIDLGWASVAEDLNAAILALAERGDDSPLRVVNLCGSAVEPEPVRSLITRCPRLESLNLQSCRGLPRGVKRLYLREQLPELQEMLQQNAEEPAD